MARLLRRLLLKDLFVLAWPVFVAQLAVMANSLIDTLMVGRYSTLDLAAVGVGSAMYFSVFVGFMGVLLALSPIAAQLYGAGRHGEIGEQVRQSAWLGVLLSVLCVAVLRWPDPLLAITQLEPAVEAKTRGYLDAMSWAVPAALAFRVFHGFSTAVSRPRTLMMLNLFGLALKVPLNYVFMYGYLGAPELGGVGCGVATAIVFWVVCVIGWAWAGWHPDYRRYRVFARWSWPRWRTLWQILSLGLPIGITFFVDVTGFTFMALFIARLGTLQSAAHQIAANFAAILFMLPLAMGNAGSVLVGQAIGAGDLRRARATGLSAIVAGVAIGLVIAVLVSLGAEGIARLYTLDDGVARLAGGLLALVAIYHVFDSVQAVAVNVLRGYKRALIPMLIYAFALWGVGLGGGYTLGLTDWLGPARGAAGFWMAAVASLLLAGGMVSAYFALVSTQAIRQKTQ